MYKFKLTDMKRFLSLLLFSAILGNLYSQDLKSIMLNSPDKTRGLPVMQALARELLQLYLQVRN